MKIYISLLWSELLIAGTLNATSTDSEEGVCQPSGFLQVPWREGGGGGKLDGNSDGNSVFTFSSDQGCWEF